MNADEFKNAAKQFGLTLPQAYLEFLAKYPARFRRMYYDYGGTRDYVCDRDFVEAPAPLIELNHEFRRLLLEVDSEEPIDSDSLWAIGHDIGGNYYVIRVGEAAPSVHFFDHETGETWILAKSLRGFSTFLSSKWKRFGGGVDGE